MRVEVGAPALVEVVPAPVVPRVLAAPHRVRRPRHEAAGAAHRVVGPGLAEEAAMYAVVLDDEDPDDEDGGRERQGKHRRRRVRQAPMEPGDHGRERAEQVRDLPPARADGRDLKRARGKPRIQAGSAFPVGLASFRKPGRAGNATARAFPSGVSCRPPHAGPAALRALLAEAVGDARRGVIGV